MHDRFALECSGMDAPIEPVTVRDQLSATESFWRLARIEGLRRAGLSKAIAAYSVLDVLLGLPGQRSSLTQIARILGLSRSNLTRMVGVLEEDGLIVRDFRRQSGDHRIVQISLTPAGQRIAERVQPIEKEVAQAIADCLSDQEKFILLQYLRRLAASARALLPDDFERRRS